MPETLLNNLRKLCLSEHSTTAASSSSSTMSPMADMVRCVDVDRERLKRQLSCIRCNPKCVYESGQKLVVSLPSVGVVRITLLNEWRCTLHASSLLPSLSPSAGWNSSIFSFYTLFIIHWVDQPSSCRLVYRRNALHSMGITKITKIMSAIWHPSVAFPENRSKIARACIACSSSISTMCTEAAAAAHFLQQCPSVSSLF